MPPTERSVQVAFWVPPRVQLLDLCGPVQVFEEARAFGAPFALHYFSASATEGSAPRSSAGLPFGSLPAFAELDLVPGDLLFVPGLDFQLPADRAWWNTTPDLLAWIREQYARGVWVCSVCTGAFVLGEAGLLADRPARRTIYGV